MNDHPTFSLSVSPDALDQLAERLAARLLDCALLRDSAPDGWMDARAAADYLGLPPSTVHKLTAAEKIPFSQDRPGAKTYFLRSQLDTWRMEGACGPWT